VYLFGKGESQRSRVGEMISAEGRRGARRRRDSYDSLLFLGGRKEGGGGWALAISGEGLGHRAGSPPGGARSRHIYIACIRLLNCQK